MSNVSQGQGWWKASDGRWYPPQVPIQQTPDLPPASSKENLTKPAGTSAESVYQPHSNTKRRFPRWVPLVGVAVIALVVGVAIGAGTSSSDKGQVKSLQSQLSAAQGRLARAQGQTSSLSAENSILQGQLKQALQEATNASAVAEKSLASKSAQVIAQARATAAQIVAQANLAKTQADAQLAAAKQSAATLAAEQNTFVGNTIPGDGLFEVGKDIKPGTYHTAGPSSTGSGDCYWARLASNDTTNIIDNGNEAGPATVVIQNNDAFFETSGCQSWTPS